ncbi:mediator of RNA polymerase II transcription subunit 13 [Ascochyta rabiei]|uniref:mediator of RNA polymerase II transcription subunit 13 n=1 Tax=Didymella rabiei TaxID=5454 RepID=UPI0021FCF550|nr:mediator of RNA polymerase II transcription subunit 13 [Ascochyta rabiei]UPX20448.1 mediator of RNA polymerase II transcription subunit 13 [Ascochyta rabiei]
MEYLKTCTTNAQVIGDFEAVAYQAFSVARTAALADGSPSEDTRAVEAALRARQLFVARDPTRPCLWLFTPTALDHAASHPADLPDVPGYLLQREHAGLTKALEYARPPLAVRYPPAASYAALAAAQNNAAHFADTRATPSTSSQATASDQPPPPDCFTVYELFTSSVVALITLSLVKECAVTALNYRTLISRPVFHSHQDAIPASDLRADPHWLTSITVQWASSGTLVVSTFTEQNHDINCLQDVSTDAERKRLVGKCVRVAPNGALGRIITFDDPLHLALEDAAHRPRRKRAKRSTLEQSIEKWKSTVKRWLSWKGYSLPNLDCSSAWVRLRTTFNDQPAASDCVFVSSDQDVLWPRALCYYYGASSEAEPPAPLGHGPGTADSVLAWFEGLESAGFRDPYDVAQEWLTGKAERDKKMLDAQRKAKKAEEDVAHHKEEVQGLFPSSPLNTRIGAYGELQPVSGVYPTPPDGVAPGASIFTSDTPSVTGAAANVILAPGGTNPAINLSAPQDSAPAATTQQPATSPAAAAETNQFDTSGGNDDLFGDDMDDDRYENVVGDDDFDFFDRPNDGDVEMTDAAPAPDTKLAVLETPKPPVSVKAESKEEASDPLASLENPPASAASDPIAGPAHQAQEKHTVAAPEHDTTKLDSDAQDQQTPSAKAYTPPLSPSRVRDALKASPKNALPLHIPQNELQDRRGSAFGPLAFSRKMSMSDAKYQGGRHGPHTDTEPKEDQLEHSRPKSLRNVPLLTKLRYAVALSSAANLPKITPSIKGASDDSGSDIDSESMSSDVSDEDADALLPTVSTSFTGGPIVSAKRKLPTEGNATPLSVTSFAESLGGDLLELQNLHLDESSLLTFEPSGRDWSLAKLPSPLERPVVGARHSMPLFPHPIGQVPDTPTSQPDAYFETPDDRPASGADSINVVQMIAEQIISATLDILDEDPATPPCAVHSSMGKRWSAVIKELFPKSADCNLPALAAVNDVFPEMSAHPKGQQRIPARKPNETPPIPGSQMYLINPPFIRVRRGETPWDLLPPAVAFWESLGLAPVNGPKNVVAFCIYPHSDSLRPCLEGFLLHMQLAYDTCKLGTHTRVETVSEYEGGLVPCRVATPAAPRAVYKALRETCVQLGKVLAARHVHIREQHDANVDAFIIYMVNPFDEPSALWELCASFWTLFQTYGQGPAHAGQPQKPDLVLQIIPIKYIASFNHPVILPSNTYVKLAHEVYSRSPPSTPNEDKTPLPIASAPAFQLEESIPRVVPFKLQSHPPQDLLRENSYIHMAYAISLDGTWLTAAWTDSCGKSQATSTYHLGTRPFRELAKEIWATTVSIVEARKVQWRVCIARAGVMDKEELETWVFLTSCPTQLNLFITLLNVDTQPSYQFTATAPASTSQSNPNTPAATPGAGVSPDPTLGLTPAATPSAVDTAADLTQDPDARLLDVTDETWGIILAHRLHNSNSTNQFNPALISGLLVKRGPTHATSAGTAREERPIAIAVNILWIGAVGSTRATASPFPPTPGGSDPAGSSYLSGGSHPPPPGTASQPPTPTQSPQQTSSLMWTPTPQTRVTAENLLKEIMQQFRGLGLLARLRGLRGGRHGTVPWHINAALRGVEGLGRVTGGR